MCSFTMSRAGELSPGAASDDLLPGSASGVKDVCQEVDRGPGLGASEAREKSAMLVDELRDPIEDVPTVVELRAAHR